MVLRQLLVLAFLTGLNGYSLHSLKAGFHLNHLQQRGKHDNAPRGAVRGNQGQLFAATIEANAVVDPKATSGDLMANVLGYLVGLGSMMLHTPNIVKLLKIKNADGFSSATWISNIIGLSAAFAYPYKKGLPFSTYVEVANILVQAVVILGIICYYQGFFQTYVIAMSIFTTLFATLILNPKIKWSPKVLNATQLSAIMVTNYALIPQILLTFHKKIASWSPISASLALIGNTIRIFTTMQLTQDKLVLVGNMIGWVLNCVLLGQIFVYPSA